MPLVPAKCPECGGLVEVDNEKRAGLCQHCGQPFVVEDAIQTFNTYYQTTNNYNTTHNYGDGAVVNVYENPNKDFVIEGGVLKKYHGEAIDVVIPEGITRIDYRCFENLDIKSIVFPKSLEIISDRFENCKNLKRITVRSNVSGDGYSNSSFDEVNLVYDNNNSTNKFSSLKFSGKKLYISDGIEIIDGFFGF